jgi:YVTN family beta-propeller protein
MLKLLPLVLTISTAAAPAAGISYSVVSEFRGPDGGWDLASVDPADHRLYVARPDGVTAVDLTTGKVTGHLVAAQRGHAALAIPGTHELIVTNGTADNASIVDGRSGRILKTFATGKKPDAVAYDRMTRTLWVMNAGDGTISIVDPMTKSVTGSVAVGGSLELAAADGHGRLYVNVEDRNEVAVIDTRTRKVIAQEPLPGCDGPTGIVYVASRKETVSACANGVAEILSTSGREVARVPIGPRPDGAAYDAIRKRVLIPSGGDGMLYVLSVSGVPRVIGKLPTAKGTRTLALDPSTGRAYLPAADFRPAQGSERPQPKPGTFRILVVAPSH